MLNTLRVNVFGKLCSGPFSGPITRTAVGSLMGKNIQRATYSGINGTPILQNKEMTNVYKPRGDSNNMAGLTTPSTNSKGKKNNNTKIRVHKYILNCLFTRNNTHFTFSAIEEDLKKSEQMVNESSKKTYNEVYLYYLSLPKVVKFQTSTGRLGFRKAARGEYEAAFQTAAKLFETIKEKNYLDADIEIVMKQFGKGRAAFVAALSGKEGQYIRGKVVRVSDATQMKFGGVRAPSARRL
ncbi:hypothetical protein TBLA_0A07780 [Henningerozyma blattae CBS 6284]|uniref:Small ribosomal subunit protein uS11m n=1 Tax=Henningerozyma blattae (strain ATCC 34711 / CBS 6284 / DSM 70876 / NBRC 10599 / NRRL Y-10934 / UCD 77-7) TaxID=1071380 RepID=I2GWR5_HENB6|nr:hypothetical protein TBLA_0A07780 [Tetrapisispora blattae CBS 6284]CCH58567.1 hypothetical protein TBLA_0A07780 [Tetrapisispora blattae CBS 6284]